MILVRQCSAISDAIAGTSLVNWPRSQHHYFDHLGCVHCRVSSIFWQSWTWSPTRVPQIKLNMWGVRQWRCKNWYNYVVLLFLSVLLCIACLPPRSSPPPDCRLVSHSHRVLVMFSLSLSLSLTSCSNPASYILIFIKPTPIYKYQQETCWYLEPVKLRILHIWFPAFYQIYR